MARRTRRTDGGRQTAEDGRPTDNRPLTTGYCLLALWLCVRTMQQSSNLKVVRLPPQRIGTNSRSRTTGLRRPMDAAGLAARAGGENVPDIVSFPQVPRSLPLIANLRAGSAKPLPPFHRPHNHKEASRSRMRRTLGSSLSLMSSFCFRMPYRRRHLGGISWMIWLW